MLLCPIISLGTFRRWRKMTKTDAAKSDQHLILTGTANVLKVRKIINSDDRYTV